MQVSLEGTEKFHKPFHLDGSVSVSITTPIESLGENLFTCLKDSTFGERENADKENFQTKLIPCASPLTWEVTPIL